MKLDRCFISSKTKLIISLIFAGWVFIYFVGCEGFLESGNCDDCVEWEPIEEEFTLQFTINEKHKEVPYIILKGNYESKDTVLIDTALSSKVVEILDTEIDYCCVAYYEIGGKTRIVIDQSRIKTKKITCGEEPDEYKCWTTLKGEVDLRIKD